MILMGRYRGVKEHVRQRSASIDSNSVHVWGREHAGRSYGVELPALINSEKLAHSVKGVYSGVSDWPVRGCLWNVTIRNASEVRRDYFL